MKEQSMQYAMASHQDPFILQFTFFKFITGCQGDKIIIFQQTNDFLQLLYRVMLEYGSH